jgi:SAM-dependent methyltransferase
MPGAAKGAMFGHAPKVLIQENPKKSNVTNIAGPDVQKMLGISDEQLKYQKVWGLDDYRKVSPGENAVDLFLTALKQSDTDYKGKTLIDFGCGTGRAGYRLWQEGMKVTLMDFASNCLDDNIQARIDTNAKDISFVEHDITKKTSLRAEWGYCCDMMEHLPPEEIDDALSTIFEASDNVFFQIATIKDHFGSHPDINEPLHLSVHDYDWWLKKFNEHGCVVHRSIESPHHVIFLVSGYGGFAYDKLKMNTGEDIVWQQMRENLSKGLKQLRPFEEQSEQKVVVLGGGPSLNNYVEEIKQLKADGAKIVTMNGTYAWAKEHGLWPVTQFMLDAREFNTRFVDPVDEGNTYILASQIHPSIVDKLPPERVWLMQCNLDPSSIEVMEEHGKMYVDWFPVCGGSTIMLRTLPALFMLGFRDIEVFGFDSCLMGRAIEGDDIVTHEHHAYEQKENDITDVMQVGVVGVAGKQFAVMGWQLCQAKEFIDFRQRLLGGMNIKVHGDGIIAHCLEHNLHHIDDVITEG